MKRLLLIIFGLSIIAFNISADTSVISEADRLYDKEDYSRVLQILQDALPDAKTDNEKAEICWRISRVILDITDDKKDEGAETSGLLDMYEEGEEYADKAVSLAPNDFNGYYWKSSNMGRWGQAKGILNSLFKAKPMKDLLHKAVTLYNGHGDSWYVLGLLYEQVPGFPLSFGNAAYSVSLARKSIDAHKIEYKKGIVNDVKYVFYIELANHLYKRNWNVSKREKENSKQLNKYNSNNDILEKNFYYEGFVNIENITDREEAKKTLRWVIGKLEKMPERKKSQEGDLKTAKETLAEWNK